MAGRKYTVEQLPERQRQQIEDALCDRGASIRGISARFGVPQASLQRYMRKRFGEVAGRAREAQEMRDGDRIFAEIRAITERCQKLYDAADRELQDPKNPDEYTLSPRARDIVVLYRDQHGKFQRGGLQELIDAHAPGPVVEVFDRGTDAKETLLRTSDRLLKQLELIGELLGKLTPKNTGGDTFIRLLMEIHEEQATGGNRSEWAEVRRARDRKEVE